MGGCSLPNKRKKKYVQTAYYKSPEYLLGIGFDTSVDIWAVGCTIYELLTSKILFDAVDYDGNIERHHLYLMIQKLGYFPMAMINASPKKDIYFSKSGKYLKGYTDINFPISIWEELQMVCNFYGVDKETTDAFIDVMQQIMTYNPNTRATADDILKHPIFSKF